MNLKNSILASCFSIFSNLFPVLGILYVEINYFLLLSIFFLNISVRHLLFCLVHTSQRQTRFSNFKCMKMNRCAQVDTFFFFITKQTTRRKTFEKWKLESCALSSSWNSFIYLPGWHVFSLDFIRLLLWILLLSDTLRLRLHHLLVHWQSSACEFSWNRKCFSIDKES